MATKTSFMRWIAGATLAVVGLWNASAVAAPPPVPATLTQQGRILDKDGEPVSSKVHFVFTVYDDPEAVKPANVLWTEEQDITLDDGYFSTELGSVEAIPADVFDGSPRYLGVTVGNDDEMAPRQSITSVPYALLAGKAAVADSAPFTGLTGIPAVCADGKYLKGFTAAGVATCGTLPALSCRTVVGTTATASTSAFVGCAAGEVTTGGGCYSTGALASSYIVPVCTSMFCLLCNGTSIACANDYYCQTTGSATIVPYARCCKVQ